MPRTITVKGSGRATAKPDTAVIAMTLETRAMNYDKAMDDAAAAIDSLTRALTDAGFAKDAVKTTDFDVRADYRDEKDFSGSYRRVFRGYVVSHELKIEFPFDTKRLSRALAALAACRACPELSVAFMVKDAAAVGAEVLRSAAANARAKAEILCAAAGVTLGTLLSIDYSWGEVNLYSHTRYSPAPLCAPGGTQGAAPVDIQPDDVDVTDTVTFVWEIGAAQD